MATNNEKANYERALDKIAELEADRDALRRKVEYEQELGRKNVAILDRDIYRLRRELEAARQALGLHRSMVICGEGQSTESELMFNKGMYGLDAARTASEKEE